MVYFVVNKAEGDKSGPFNITETDFPVAPYIYQNYPVIAPEQIPCILNRDFVVCCGIAGLVRIFFIALHTLRPRKKKNPRQRKKIGQHMHRSFCIHKAGLLR